MEDSVQVDSSTIVPHDDEDIRTRALRMFDSLVSQGRLFYEPTEAEVVEHNGFKFEFRISSALLKKPILSADAPERQGHGGPFLEPDADFVVAPIGEHHILELSMHCIYRPAYVLHTRLFAPQTDDLDIHDLRAALATMENLGSKVPQMVIYNCGLESGSSQGHKHMQVFAYPECFDLFPEHAQSASDISTNFEDVPYRHFVLRLAKRTPEDILKTYHRLLEEMRRVQSRFGNVKAYNVALTRDWICLIPRTHARKDGDAGANTAGMLGLVWLRDQAERDMWARLNYTCHLQYLGIPIDVSETATFT